MAHLASYLGKRQNPLPGVFNPCQPDWLLLKLVHSHVILDEGVQMTVGLLHDWM